MKRPPFRSTLLPAAESAIRFLESLPERSVKARANGGDILTAIDRPLPDAPGDPATIVAELVERADPGITSMPSGRFFGWVIGGGLPSAIAADWLTSAWDQNAGSTEGTPSAAAFEQVALAWVIDLLGLPKGSSGAIVTGAQMANMVGSRPRGTRSSRRSDGMSRRAASPARLCSTWSPVKSDTTRSRARCDCSAWAATRRASFAPTRTGG